MVPGSDDLPSKLVQIWKTYRMPIILGLGAAKLSDGAKIYIPKTGDTVAGLHPANDNSVSVNAASQSELEALTGIGPATAKKAMGGTPYKSLIDIPKIPV